MNQYTISGNIGADAIIKSIKDKYYISFNVGVYNGKDNTLWVSVLSRRTLETAEGIRDLCKKGRKVLVQGKLAVSAYIDHVGSAQPSVTIFADNIEFLTPLREPEKVEPVTGVDTTPKPDTRNEYDLPF